MSDTTSRPAGPLSPPPRFHSPLALPLLEEWDRLRRSRAITARLRSGSLADLTTSPFGLAPLDALLDACGFLRPTTEAADGAMRRLVREASTDELAARIALQRSLPAIVAIARRRGPIEGGAQRAFDEVVGCAWIRIRSYPLERRPHKIAPNIVRDAEYLAFVQPRRLRSAGERVGLPPGPDETPAALDGRGPDGIEPLAEVVDLLDTARRSGVPSTDLDFASAWLSGADTVELARRFGVCERTVRNRRREVAERLRRVALAA